MHTACLRAVSCFTRGTTHGIFESRSFRDSSRRRAFGSVRSSSELEGALAGVRVLDLTRVLAGPYCTMMLGDMGAEVIKVEKPKEGDDTRSWGPPFAVGGESAYFISVNRNKKSITIDLKKPEGIKLIKEFAARCDVLVENFVPGLMETYGIGYKTLSDINPKLIYASITGFGPDGPSAKKLGYDLIASATGGLLAITGEENGGPVKAGVALTDISTGQYTHGAICAALFARTRTGRGQRIDTSLLESQVANLVNAGSAYLVGGVETKRRGTAHESIVPYQAFRTSDGEVIAGAGNNKQFARMCSAMGLPQLVADPKFGSNNDRVNNRKELLALLEQRFLTKSTREWVEILSKAHIPTAPINNMSQVFSDPHVLYREMVQEIEHPTAGKIRVVGFPVKFSDTKSKIRLPPPLLGQHTEEVLHEMLGYSKDKITELKENGVL